MVVTGQHSGRPDAGGQSVRPDAVAHPSPLRTSTVWFITAALVVLLGGFPVKTEIVFHRRDHLDQGKYLSNQPVYNVRSYFDALVGRAHHS